MAFIVRTKWLNILIAAVTVFITLLPFAGGAGHAAVPKLDQIRVTLFIDIRGTVPTVTMSSPQGLNVGLRQPAGIKHWISIGADSPVRGSIDQFMVKIAKTANLQTAQNFYNKAQSAGYAPYIFETGKGQNLYQVYIGQFSTYEAALQAKNRLSSLTKSAVQEISGPLHWNAGTFSNEQAADQLVASMRNLGLDAFKSIQESSSGKPVYSAWLGEAVDAAQLNKIKGQAVKVMPNLALKQVNPSSPYLLLRNDVSGGKSAVGIPHYFFNGNGQKVWVSAAGGGIKVDERFGRTYRGSMELSKYNGGMAVINQLPFEEYLYSVLGSELSAGWPLEALKAQAVAARTYALTMGMKYKIAHISDTTYDQAYFGMDKEFPAAIQAVDATAGEVLVNRDGLITPLYYANSGGVTADSSEGWGTPLSYIQSVKSPDQDAANGKLPWYRIALNNGQAGYIRSDLAQLTDRTNAAGLPYIKVLEDGINIREAPFVNNNTNPPIAQVYSGDLFVVIGEDIESNSFNWIRGPYTATEMQDAIHRNSNAEIAGSLRTLEIAERGPSGRVTKMKANGQTISVSQPDAYRTMMNGLPSTRFDVEETGRYTILGAKGSTRNLPAQSGTLYAVSGGQRSATGKASAMPQQANLYLMNGDHQVRVATQEAKFRFIGLGNGHGLGMSQWGAKALAELQYDYQSILQYYYLDVSLVKE